MARPERPEGQNGAAGSGFTAVVQRLRRSCRSLVLPAFVMCAGLIGAGQLSAQPADDAEREALRDFLMNTVTLGESFEDRFDAEVWLVDMSERLKPFVADTEARLTLLRQIHAAATDANLSPELVLAVIEVESAFDRFAVSRVGAQGLMQVMPFWKAEIGRADDNLTDNLTNLAYGCRILQYYLQRENGALHEALAAYNGSSGRRTYSDKVAAAWRSRWRTAPLDWSR